MNEIIVEEREDFLAEVEADENWWVQQDADEQFIREWEIAHSGLEAWD